MHIAEFLIQCFVSDNTDACAGASLISISFPFFKIIVSEYVFDLLTLAYNYGTHWLRERGGAVTACRGTIQAMKLR